MARILLVDDEEMILTVLKTLLRTAGHEILTVQNGPDAFEIVRAQELDLIITDLRMTPMNGIELLRLVHKERPELPSIMLTAFASSDTAKEAKELGAFGYIRKPFTGLEVFKTVNEALAASNKKKQAKAT